jgi:hypothetical protein
MGAYTMVSVSVLVQTPEARSEYPDVSNWPVAAIQACDY